MKFARFRVDGHDYYGQLDGDRLRAIQGDLFSGDFRVTRASYPLSRVKLLPPSRPFNYWGIGENYKVHVDFRKIELGEAITRREGRFSPWYKSAGCIIATDEPITVPVDCPVLEYEGELCIVIGKRASRISEADAPGCIIGYTVSNDLDGGGAWHLSGLWKQKMCDGFGPVGPWIETEVDPHRLEIITRVDGREEDRGSTRDMVHNCYAIVSGISQFCTLHPGDLITTGAPGLTRGLNPGEVVEVEIPGIGTLRNPIVADSEA